MNFLGDCGGGHATQTRVEQLVEARRVIVIVFPRACLTRSILPRLALDCTCECFTGYECVSAHHANYLYNLNGIELVGFDVGLCTMTPAVNNTGSLYELCNIIHYFNNGADQVMINCTIQSDAVSLNAIYVCDFWTPNYAS